MTNKKICRLICDPDGKILSFNKDCETFFGYSNDFIIKSKRIYNLLHSNFIIEFINEFEAFKNSDKDSFRYKVNIVNFSSCVSSVLLLVKKRSNKKFISIDFFKSDSVFINHKRFFLSKINIILRTKFTLGSLIPFCFGCFLSISNFDVHSYTAIFLLFFGLLFFHIAANTFNDYFDWRSGRDELNVDYVLFSTGGSRALDFKIVSEKHMLLISIISFIMVFLCGVCLIFLRGYVILLLGVIGVLSVYFYSAPPIHLASRYGAGELMHIICLGPLIIYGCVFSLTGYASFKELLIGMPFGLLITACLLLNEVPDSRFDKISKKNNLAVFFGIKYVPYVFYMLVLLAFSFLIFCVLFFNFTFLYLLVLFILPYIFYNIRILFKIHTCRNFVLQSCAIGFHIYLYFGLFLISLTILDVFLYSYPW